MTDKQPLQHILSQIRASDQSCSSDTDALTVVGLLAFAAALAQFDDIRKSVVLKGGTVLRMLEQGKLLRSPTKDLDASLLCEIDEFTDRVETVVVDTCNEILEQTFIEKMEFFARYQENEHKRRPQDNKMYEFKLECHAQIKPVGRPMRANENRFKFEASTDEGVDDSLLIDFPNTLCPFEIRLKCYAPLQSLAEKLRAILQKRRYHEQNIKDGRGVSDGNFPPRHVLDIETLYHHCIDQLDKLPEIFREKCKVKKVPLSMLAQEYFDHEILWKLVEGECQKYDRDFEQCKTIYWTCVSKVLG